MTNRRKNLPIMATVIGLVLAGCGGGGGQTVSVTVSSSNAQAIERALGNRGGNSAPGRRRGSAGAPANNARGGTHGGRRGQCYGDGSSRWCRFRIPEQHGSRRCVEPCGIAGQRDGIDGAYNCLHEHREPEAAVRQRIYP